MIWLELFLEIEPYAFASFTNYNLWVVRENERTQHAYEIIHKFIIESNSTSNKYLKLRETRDPLSYWSMERDWSHSKNHFSIQHLWAMTQLPISRDCRCYWISNGCTFIPHSIDPVKEISFHLIRHFHFFHLYDERNWNFICAANGHSFNFSFIFLIEFNKKVWRHILFMFFFSSFSFTCIDKKCEQKITQEMHTHKKKKRKNG